jgi:hypothetical protein
MKVETAGSEPGVLERGQGPTMSNPRPTGNPEVSEVRGCRTGFPPHTTPTRNYGANLKRDGPSFFAQCWRQLPLLPCLKIHHPLARKNKTPTTPPSLSPVYTPHSLSLSLSLSLRVFVSHSHSFSQNVHGLAHPDPRLLGVGEKRKPFLGASLRALFLCSSPHLASACKPI